MRCIEFEIDELVLGAGGSRSPDSVRVAVFDAGLRLGFSSSVSLATVAVDAFRRPKSSDGRDRLVPVLVLVFVFSVGLVPMAPLHVAEAGSRGGGISPILGACKEESGAFWDGFRDDCGCAECDAALEDARRQPLRLSLRRSEEPDVGVSGSGSVEVCAESEVSFFCRGLGPATIL